LASEALCWVEAGYYLDASARVRMWADRCTLNTLYLICLPSMFSPSVVLLKSCDKLIIWSLKQTISSVGYWTRQVPSTQSLRFPVAFHDHEISRMLYRTGEMAALLFQRFQERINGRSRASVERSLGAYDH
jgi:hypothetical protein